MPAKLKNGVIGASGGKREGAGRKPDAFKRWMKNLVHSPKARARFRKIIEDGNAEISLTPLGGIVRHPAKADTYLRALELGWHYAEGKPVSRIELPGNGSGRLVFVFPSEDEK